MNEDPMLHGKITYSLAEEFTHVGRKNGNPVPQIIINGMGIQDSHATFHYIDNKILLKPVNDSCSEFLYVNGKKIKQETEVFTNDRIIFGKSSTFLV